LAGRVVEGEMTVAALPDPPAEDLGVEVGRALDVDSRDLDVTHLAIR
jgi:hypothetical protein